MRLLRATLDGGIVCAAVWALACVASSTATIRKGDADRGRCFDNMRRLSTGILAYAADADGTLPPVVRDDRGVAGCADRTPKFLPILNYPGNPGWVTHFVPGSQWNRTVLKYVGSTAVLTCPADPTTPYKTAPSLSYSAATGPESLWRPKGCEVANGVMGTNWGDRLEAIEKPGGTALLFEHIIDPAIDPWQHNVGTVVDEDWPARKDLAWCFGKKGGAAYMKQSFVFSYNTQGFQGPHRGGGHVATCDGQAIWVPKGGGRVGGSEDCREPAQRSLFDKRHPL